MLTKQQVQACLAGESPPHVPAWLFWMDQKFVDINSDQVKRMREQHSDDFLSANMRLTKRATDPVLEPGEYTDDWGCLFRASPDGVGAHPTRAIVQSIDEWDAYAEGGLPVLDAERTLSSIRSSVTENPNRYVVAHVWRTFFERMFMLIGYESLMIEIATDGALFRRMLESLNDFTVQAIDLVAQAGADAVFLADDWASQDRLMISPRAWAKCFKPAYAAMIETAHGHGMDVWFHSCGNIASVVPHWIDIGLDVISPLQTAAIDLPALAAAYRGQITFFGGIDVQFNLVSGTSDTIRHEVKSLLEVFHASEGKFMISPSNTIMPETPVDNVWTLFEAIREYGSFSQRA